MAAKFKARARTVDMLGRQQIAGAPAAISELFKNAHDAYADRAEIDYYRPEKIFLLRDNGVGMTRDEFEEKWLALGTESKVANTGLLSYRPDGAQIRAIMGEKGIGRLAIARIGPQVLVMTRAKRGDQLHDLVVAFVNWEIFEAPGLNLDEIEIPVVTIPDGELPDFQIVGDLINRLRTSIETFSGRISSALLERIRGNLQNFKADPKKIDAFFNRDDSGTPHQSPLSLRNSGSGTHFLIQPADPFLGEEIDRDRVGNTEEPAFTKYLVGFGNEMIPNAPTPPLRTAFRDWRFPESGTDIIGAGTFLNAEDFRHADHHFSGRFDEFGQFSGIVKVYDCEAVQHTVPWTGGEGQETLCGPFTVNIAFLQGNARESQLPPDDWAQLKAKLDRFGGMYVYRDGVRVLPYGNSDFDWLEIETRRNKGQGYYFFAYRRMFGAVELTHFSNSALIEKAGREGFQQNKAYRQLTAILVNFFVQLAADFFRGDEGKAAIYAERKTELERMELARRKREESVFQRRKMFNQQLEEFFSALDAKEPEIEVNKMLRSVADALKIANTVDSPDKAAEMLIEAEGYAERELDELRKKRTIARPRDIGLSVATKREWEAYVEQRKRLETEVYSVAGRRIQDTIGAAAEAAKVHIDQRKRLQLLIGEAANEVERTLKEKADDTKTAAEEKFDSVKALVRKALTEVKDAIDSVRAELQRKDLNRMSSADVESFRLNLEEKIAVVSGPNREALDNARQQLLEMNFERDPSNAPVITSGDMTGALEEEVLALRDAADADSELIQLGMALAVVNHEFDAVIKAIRGEMRRFKGWANATPQLRPIYERISANFEHLDGYLGLFTPLQRRLYRNPQRIAGTDIEKFLTELFQERLARHSVTLLSTPAFAASAVEGYPSTFYPVFVNLVDNAIYWLKDRRGARTILLDAEGDNFFIANNGPAIASKDREAVFDLRFTRKPGGRGMGLFISRRTLQKAGYEMILVDRDDFPVCFKICKSRKTGKANGVKDESPE